MTDRPIDESHEALIRTALKLEGDTPLPEAVVSTYWDTERTARRLFRRGLNDTELILVLLLAGRPTLEKPVSFLDEKAEPGDTVLAKHRGKWQWGIFKSYKGKSVVVQLEDETAEDREFDAISVRRPAREELETIQ